jgi:hypothetical protein
VLTRYAPVALIPVGAALALAGWTRAGVIVALVGFFGTLLLHLVDGFVGYRRSMDHEWPPTQPREWDDD